MYGNTEFRIMEKIYLSPGIHKRELSKQLKLGMPSIDYGIRKVDKLLIKKRSGNQIKYFLDYSKEAITSVIYAIEHNRLDRLPMKIKIAVRDLLKEIKDKPLIAVIFGSYAKGDYTKESDIDILLVFQKIENTKELENTAKRISMRTSTELNPAYLDYDSFKDSFHDSTKKFFKNLKDDRLFVAGIEWWRQLEDEEA
ncbi:MAG: nucleotidyltransferase domain-containing protein [Candidatus Woesearchaeota archaeon]